MKKLIAAVEALPRHYNSDDDASGVVRLADVLRLIREHDPTAAIVAWTQVYGAALCPNGRPDTFGEGMRAAKDEVRALLRHLGADDLKSGKAP